MADPTAEESLITLVSIAGESVSHLYNLVGLGQDTQLKLADLQQSAANHEFFLTVIAIATCWSCGLATWTYFLYVKNHRNFW